jgi:hypothetical protein
MRCGAPAAVERTKTFSWHPPWVLALILVGLLPFVIVALVLTKRMTVHAPMCELHQNHWRWRAWFVWLGFAVLVILGIASVALMAAMENRHGRGIGSTIAGLSCAGVLFAALGWLIAAAIIQMGSIHPTEITDYSITLVKVSPAFAEASWDERQRRGEPDLDERRRRGRPGEGEAYREGRPW